MLIFVFHFDKITPLTTSLNIMGIVKTTQLRCRVTVSHNHPVKKLASKTEYHTGQRYSDAVGYIRKRLRFEILRVISLRGDRGARKNIVDINSLDLNLKPKGQG